MRKITENKFKTIVLGGGCFWCLEAVFNRIKGIEAISGYAGGTIKNPSYDQVCSGKTGHAEVVKINYDPTIITLEEILEIFFEIHDPTTLNRQGYDIGTQYRSIILYTNTDEKKTIEEVMKKAEKKWKEKIVTEVKQLREFYIAEDYHQNYFDKNPNERYCRFIIQPKIDKLKKEILPKVELL